MADSDPAPVDGRWQGWVAENILLYSEVLRLLLPRFFRMDLTASKNAYMLFRIAKVFSQPGLSDLIRSAEAGLERGSGGRGLLKMGPAKRYSIMAEGKSH